MLMFCLCLRKEVFNMKMIYYSSYKKNGDFFEGTGTRIIEDRKDFLQNDDSFIRLTAELEVGKLWELGIDDFYDFYRRFFEKADEVAHQFNEFQRDMEKLQKGQLLMDTSDWIDNLKKGMEKAAQMTKEEGESSVKRFRENLKKVSEERERLETKERIKTDYSNDDNLFERLISYYGIIGQDAFRKDGDNYRCEKFSFNKQWFYEEMKKVSKMVVLFNEINEKKVQTNTDKTKLLNAISNCMSNVRYIHEWESKRAEIKVTPLPMNVLGEVTLIVLDAFKKEMAFITCEKCGDIKRMKRESSHICRTCQNASYQRKNNIKKDMKQGLSLEDILAKRKRMDKNEIIKMYNELKKEL